MTSNEQNLSPADLAHEPFALRHTNGKCDALHFIEGRRDAHS